MHMYAFKIWESYPSTGATHLYSGLVLPLPLFSSHVSRREGLGALAAKVQSKCDEVSTEAKDLAEEVAELEKKSAGMGSSEMAASAQQLSDKIQVSVQQHGLAVSLTTREFFLPSLLSFRNN